jgi:hypothetical protein
MGGTNVDYGLAVTVDRDGDAYAVGTFVGRATFGGIRLEGEGRNTGFIAKIAPQGDVVWANAFGGPYSIEIGGVGVDPAGFVYVTGSFLMEADFGTNHLVAPGTPLPFSTATDVFLVKYDANGGLIWARNYGGSDIEYGRGLSVSDSGAVYLAGSYRKFAVLDNMSLPGTGLDHVWVAKLNGDGDAQWAAGAGSGALLYPNPKVTSDAQGNVYVAGGFLRSIDFPANTVQLTVTNRYCVTNQVVVSEPVVLTNLVCVTNLDVIPPRLECTNQYVVTNYYSVSNYVTCTNLVVVSNVTEYVHLEGGDRRGMFLAKYDSSGRFLWARKGGVAKATCM